MQCTPESNIYLQSCKGQQSYDCSDSGYSGLFRSPRSVAGADSCKSLSPEECGGTSKENLRPSVTPSWCETPRRDSSLRQRRLICRLAQPVKADLLRSPCSSGTDASLGWLSFSFDSTDGDTGPLDPAQDLPLSCRKRRLLFTQTRTSTLDDGKLNSAQLSSFGSRISLSDAEFSENLSAADQRETPISNKLLPGSSKRSFRSPIGSVATDLYDDTSALCTPSSTHTPKFIRSACEDSGFSSLTLDKDSPVDYDGSFQELLLSASRGHAETPNLAESKRRSRLLRQNRLSTLKEGGSQSEEDLADRRHARSHRTCSHSKDDDVFAENAPPHAATSADGLAPGRPCYTTPLRATRAKPENATLRGTSAVPDETPHGRTSVNLSLTPALQLVHAMCQQKAQMFTGHSPSLKEQLRYTAALTETPVTFRTSLPLAGLIGRKMGLGKVDILTELKRRNLRHVLSLILGELSPESVYRCAQVCKSWSEVVQQDEGACLKRRTHLMEVDAGLESGGAHHVPEAETRLTLLKRSALKSVQAQSRSSSFCTPQSAKSTLTPLQHSGSSKRDKFIEVAKTLFNDECLKPCPRCQHPARCHSVKGEGICSRADCGFQFCTACLCTFHGSRECGSQSVGRHNKDKLLPGSAQSKRNVRRL